MPTRGRHQVRSSSPFTCEWVITVYGNLGGTTNRGDSPLLTSLSLSLSLLSSLLTYFSLWPRPGRPFLFKTSGLRWSLWFILFISAWCGRFNDLLRCLNLTSRFLGFQTVGSRTVWRSFPSGSHRPGFVLTLLDFFNFSSFSCFFLFSLSSTRWLRSRCPRPNRDSRRSSTTSQTPILVTKACIRRFLILHSSFQPAILTLPTPNRRPLNVGNGPHCPHSRSILALNNRSPPIYRLHQCHIPAPVDIVGDQASLLGPISW